MIVSFVSFGVYCLYFGVSREEEEVLSVVHILNSLSYFYFYFSSSSYCRLTIIIYLLTLFRSSCSMSGHSIPVRTSLFIIIALGQITCVLNSYSKLSLVRHAFPISVMLFFIKSCLPRKLMM